MSGCVDCDRLRDELAAANARADAVCESCAVTEYYRKQAAKAEARYDWLARETYRIIKEARHDLRLAHDALSGYDSRDALMAAAREATRG